MSANELRDRLILDYLNGAMPEGYRSLFEAEAASDAGLAAEIAAISGARRVFQADDAGAAPQDAGWRRLSSAIDAEKHRTPANDNRLAGAFWRAPLARAAAIACAAVLGWEVMTTAFTDPAETDQYRPVSETSQGFTARVMFAPDAQIDDITALLRSVDASLDDGPSAIGLYTIKFASDEARAAALLKLSTDAPSVISITKD